MPDRDATARKTPNWRLRLFAELRRDRKKATMLILLLVVAGALGGRMVFKHVAEAEADTLKADGGQDAPQTGADGPVTPGPGPSGAGGPAWTSNASITRDIFKLNVGVFPVVDGGEMATLTKDPAPGGTDHQRAQMRRVQAEARALTLQSTIIGATPTAIINGRVIREGKTINGFRVVAVTARGCVIEKQGVKIALQMKGFRTSFDSDGEQEL